MNRSQMIVGGYTLVGFALALVLLDATYPPSRSYGSWTEPVPTLTILGFAGILALFYWVGGAVAEAAAEDPAASVLNWPAILRSLPMGALVVGGLLALTALLLQLELGQLAFLPVVGLAVVVGKRARAAGNAAKQDR